MRIQIIGAHPDDCEFRCGGTANLCVQRGDVVQYVSLTNGCCGHHEMQPESLVERRKSEALAAAAVAGVECQVLDIQDGHLEATLENRLKVIRLIREFKPDLVITNRPNDYHADHRYTSQLVQDASFLLMVPNVAPEVAAMDTMPVITYFWDGFQKPSPFKADIAVDIESVFNNKIRQLAAHESQFFEWLPHVDGCHEPVPNDPAHRLDWLKAYFEWLHSPSISDSCRESLVQRYGQERGALIQQAEAFELCEYGRQPSSSELKTLFP